MSARRDSGRSRVWARGALVFLGLVFSLGCASVGGVSALGGQTGGAPRLAEQARLDELQGRDAEALAGWAELLLGDEGTVGERAWAAARVEALLERHAADTERIRGLLAGEIPPALREHLALVVGDASALRQARQQQGWPFQWRAQGGGCKGAACQEGRWQQSVDGWVTVPAVPDTLLRLEVQPPEGMSWVQVESEIHYGMYTPAEGGAGTAWREPPLRLRPRIAEHALVPGGGLGLIFQPEGDWLRVRLRFGGPSDVAPLAVGEAVGSRSHAGAVELALARGDVAAAYEALEGVEAGPWRQLMEAWILLDDPTFPPSVARLRAQELLAAVLREAPTWQEARALAVQLHVQAHELEQAWALLGPLDGDVGGALVVAAASLGMATDTASGRRLTARALAHAPKSCTALRYYLDGWSQALVRRPEELAGLVWPLLPSRLDCVEAHILLADALARAGETEGAVRLLEGLSEVGARPDGAAQRLGALKLAQGELGEAARWAARGKDRRLEAQIAVMAGEQPKGQNAALVGFEWPPQGGEAREAVVLKALKSGRPEMRRRILWHEEQVRVAADGRLKILVHRAEHLGDREATQRVGELEIPQGAEVLRVRTWQQDKGQTRLYEPEEILEKETISLPKLQPGDVAEWAYLYTVAPVAHWRPDWRAPRFFFNDLHGEVRLARFRISLEEGARPPRFILDPTLDPPKRPDEQTWVFEARDEPRVLLEEGDAMPEARFKSVLAMSSIERPMLQRRLSKQMARLTRQSPSLRALAEEVVGALGPKASSQDKMKALYHWVQHEIEDTGGEGPFDVEASWIAARRRGPRTTLLAALCGSVGLSCEVVLARPLWEGPEPSYPEEHRWTYALVRWELTPDDVFWLDPSALWMPWGYLPPAVQGGDAVSLGVWREDGGRIRVPQSVRVPEYAPERWGEREVTLEVHLEADGAAVEVEGEERLSGVFGAAWRGVLLGLAPAERVRVLEGVARDNFSQAEIRDVEILALQEVEAPLVWRYRARVPTRPGQGLKERQGRLVHVLMMAEALTEEAARLDARTSELFVNIAVHMKVDIRFFAPRGWLFERAPADRSLEFEGGHYERVSAFLDRSRQVRVQKGFVMRPRMISPAEYPTWREVAQRIDLLDLIEIYAARTGESQEVEPLESVQGQPPAQQEELQLGQ